MESEGVGSRTLPYNPEIWNLEEVSENDDDLLDEIYDLEWGIEYSQFEVCEMEKAEHVNRKRIVV